MDILKNYMIIIIEKIKHCTSAKYIHSNRLVFHTLLKHTNLIMYHTHFIKQPQRNLQWYCIFPIVTCQYSCLAPTLSQQLCLALSHIVHTILILQIPCMTLSTLRNYVLLKLLITKHIQFWGFLKPQMGQPLRHRQKYTLATLLYIYYKVTRYILYVYIYV